ncbi:hypothetical protein D3C78_549170 [compost metagenome]
MERFGYEAPLTLSRDWRVAINEWSSGAVETDRTVKRVLPVHVSRQYRSNTH